MQILDLTDIDELIENIQKSYVNAINKTQTAFNEQLNTYKQIGQIINHDMKIIQLLNGEDS